MNIIRCGIDTAGGVIGSTPNQNFCFVEGYPIALVGENVAAHGYHYNVTMVQGSLFVFINGLGICRSGDQASCGHIAGPGSFYIFSM